MSIPGNGRTINPAKGHCDVSSFVAWEHLGGDLVLGEVHLNGEFQEHHYWNRIDGADLDLTHGQFRQGEAVTEKEVLRRLHRGQSDAMNPASSPESTPSVDGSTSS